MIDQEDVDPAFLNAISSFISTSEELEFERRGISDSTYTLHGKIISIDRKNGTVQIQCTRTHNGEIHQLELWLFLSATQHSGVKVENQIAVTRNEVFRERQRAREAAVASVSVNPRVKLDVTTRRSRFVGKHQGLLNGFPSERYMFEGLEECHRKIGLIASSHAAADQFMSMQDIFMPLDDMVWQAIDSRVIWPAGIAFDRQVNPSAWPLDWFKLFDILGGIPKEVLKLYLKLLHNGRVDFGATVMRSFSDKTLLIERGLLEVENAPTLLTEILERVPVTGLCQLLKQTSSNLKAKTRGALTEELLGLATAKLQTSAVELMRSHRARIRAPAGLTVEEFDRAIRELRDSIFLMRQWILATRELYREDELSQLVNIA